MLSRTKWLCALVVVLAAASSLSAIAADKSVPGKAGPLIGRDWDAYCKQNNKETPACIKDCRSAGGAQGNMSCKVYCNNKWFAGNCFTNVSCPGNPC